MAEVQLIIGGRSHTVACRDGEEAELEALGRRLDRHADAAARAAGSAGGERMMLFIALMLADELAETERTRGDGDGNVAAVLQHIARRLESVATALENGPVQL
ncbi:cell division protein ZapA [Sphingomonas cannabina]|uniref:cell division protein ZapA n=1 Tax=Sphingomonas cannabina TaxID=2899123 RepID=UPI001F391E68|nr:cell division protein ZapA [Sphingomonas cannabina]UIJ43938.1 cell division protein ZapA [Sphingomonas cannabina]